jgi:hypothetical protein
MAIRSISRSFGSRLRRTAALAVSLCGAAVLPLQATDPGTALETAALVRSGTPGLIRAGKGVVEIPRQAARCLLLPLGLTEMLFAPLPEVDFMEGLRDTGKGLTAPFKLCMATLEMPYEVVGGLGDALCP